MAGLTFIVNVPKKEYEIVLRGNNIPNKIYEQDKLKVEDVSKVINELKEKQQINNTCYDFIKDYYIKCSATESSPCLNNKAYKCNNTDNSFFKTALDNVNQLIPSTKKFKLEKSPQNLHLLEPLQCDGTLETILSEIVTSFDIKNAVWNSTKDNEFWQVTFGMELGMKCEDLLNILETFGIGSRFQSTVSVLPCSLYFKCNDSTKNVLLRRDSNDGSGIESSCGNPSSEAAILGHNNLAQVLNDVRANARLTFDWLFLLLIAAFVAAVGLVENSITILVASMLISPLMGPITAGTLGTALNDRCLQMMGVINEFLGLFISLVVGFMVGLALCIVDEKYKFIEDWPTEEMLSRCALRSIWVGVLVAIPSGAGCALAVLGDYTASLVGVAISATLLPPAVNAGILWAMSLNRLLIPVAEHHWLIVLPSELALLGTASLCLTLVNIICIFISGVAVYKLKAVEPMVKTSKSNWNRKVGRFNNARRKTKDKLEWDAYTTWCTNSLERKEKQCHANNVKNSELESVAKNLKKEPTLQKIALRVHYNDKYSKDIEKQSLTEQNSTSSKEENASQEYHNFAYEPISGDTVSNDDCIYYSIISNEVLVSNT